jgi:hypothetical protein
MRAGRRAALRGEEQRIGKRLGTRTSVAAHDHGGARPQPEAFEHRAREALELVGHDPPGDAARLEAIEEGVHARKEPRADAKRPGVDLEEFLAHRGVVRMIRPDPERGRDHAARAPGNVGPNRLLRDRLQPAAFAHHVHGSRHVGRGIGEGAVEVEKNCLDHVPFSSSPGGNSRPRRGRGSTPW